MSQNVTDLTPEQNQAIDLYITGKSTGDIAKKLGVHRRTIWRWRQLPAFVALQRELQQRRQEEIRERFTEVIRLAFVSLERELKKSEELKYCNPVDTAIDVIKLMHSVPILTSPMMSPPASLRGEEAYPQPPEL